MFCFKKLYMFVNLCYIMIIRIIEINNGVRADCSSVDSKCRYVFRRDSICDSVYERTRLISPDATVMLLNRIRTKHLAFIKV